MNATPIAADPPLERSRGTATARTFSRALDLLVAIVGLVLIAPVLVLIAAAIRLDSSGPALFRQRRLGRNGEPFTVLKFRTMHAGADPRPHRHYVEGLLRAGSRSAVRYNGLYKLAVDDRITRVGRVLRRLSADELPQLFNVLRGQMALVGPRPVIPYEAELYPEWYRERFEVKPGLTGLWQVSGRNEHTYEQMVAFDIEYVRRRSIALDLQILARTPLALLTRTGA